MGGSAKAKEKSTGLLLHVSILFLLLHHSSLIVLKYRLTSDKLIDSRSSPCCSDSKENK